MLIDNWRKRLLLSLVVGCLLSAGVDALSHVDNHFKGWLAACLLLCPAVYILLSVWKWAGGERSLALMVSVAFLLRLGGGMILSMALPHYGYDNPQQKAGYPFKDSYFRDAAAWKLAQSEEPLWVAFQQEFATDQYGGLLSLSAVVYRSLSPDAHRPYLILILVSFVYSLGVIFFWKGLVGKWDASLAGLATWILILYPEGIFFTISQMREPFLIAGSAIAFWCVLSWQRSRRNTTIGLAASIAFMALISWRVTIALAIVLVVWFWLENLTRSSAWSWKVPRWVILAVTILIGILLLTSWTWLRTSMWWDFIRTERNSERLVIEIENIGGQWRPFVIIGFGMAQIILPAAIAQPAIALWRSIAIFRSAGWYLLAPMILYSPYVVWKARSPKERRVLLWLMLATFLWIIIASARAGGDLWDNPRYRTIFLPWMAVIATWSWKNRGAWLYRLFIIECVFLAFFTQWYLARYYFGTWLRMPFWHILMWVAVISGLILGDGLILTLWKRFLHHPVKSLRLRLVEGVILALFFEWYVSGHYFTPWMQTTSYSVLHWGMVIAGLVVIGYAVMDSVRGIH